MKLLSVSGTSLPLEIVEALFAGVTLLVAFVIASASARFHGYVKTSLDNEVLDMQPKIFGQ